MASFAPDESDLKKILAAHAEWECGHHNELIQQTQKAKVVYEKVGKQEWAHWTYDMSGIWKHLKEERPELAKNPRGPQTQHFLTTVVGKNVLVIICTTMSGDNEEESKKLLLESAASLQKLAVPLSSGEIITYCEKPLKPSTQK